jgi:hypothetical protein
MAARGAMSAPERGGLRIDLLLNRRGTSLDPGLGQESEAARVVIQERLLLGIVQ